jgi:GIY-YIG catalytic domain
MRPHVVGDPHSEARTGILYMLGFPASHSIYIGSSTQPGATRFRQHILRLRGKRHSNKTLQGHYNEQKVLPICHVVCCVYGVSKTELMNYEWGLSIRLHSEYFVLSDDTTKNLKHYLESEDEKAITSIINKVMGDSL